MRPRTRFFSGLVAVIGLVALTSLFGCSRGRAPEQTDEKAADTNTDKAPASEAASDWIVFVKSGGIAGFHFVLEMDTDGGWLAVNKARPDSLRGQFSSEETAALAAAMEAIPESDWKTYSSKVYDDFQYQITRRERGGVRRMDGNDQALPEHWKSVVSRLEAPFTELMMRR